MKRFLLCTLWTEWCAGIQRGVGGVWDITSFFRGFCDCELRDRTTSAIGLRYNSQQSDSSSRVSVMSTTAFMFNVAKPHFGTITTFSGTCRIQRRA